MWGGGRSPGEHEAGGTQEMGEERTGNGISTIAGNEREIQKCNLLLFVAAYIQSMKWTQQNFLTSIQHSPQLKAKFHMWEN